MGRICIDSGAVGEVVGDMVIRDRRLIAEDGIVLPIIAINRHTGRLESTPEIVSRGFALAGPAGRRSCGAGIRPEPPLWIAQAQNPTRARPFRRKRSS